MTGVNNVMWTEKYRPDTLDDVIGHDGVVSSLRQWAENGELPNLLFSGPAGTGKTALATAFAKDYYGDTWRQNFMELNASDERGIDVVREQIKSYAGEGTVGDYGFSIIFLDEADSLTKDAQSALRRVMEDYASDTRFILSCNYANKLIDPIQSRCSVERVSPLKPHQVKQILRRVVEGEDLGIGDDALDLIIEHSGGDARRAISTLHRAVTGDRDLSDIVSPIDSDALEEIARDAISGKLSDAQTRINTEFLKEGIESAELAGEMMRVLNRIEMPEDSRVLAFDKLGECEWRAQNGANPHVQWSAFLANLYVARHMSFEAYQ